MTLPFKKGHKPSEETKRKISEANKGKKRSEKIKQKIRLGHIGKKHSEETIRKISETKKGHITTEETKRKLSEAWKLRKLDGKANWRSGGYVSPLKGRKRSEETKRKMRGRRRSEETKRKMRETQRAKKLAGYVSPLKGRKSPLKGRKRSEETKRKMRERQRAKKLAGYVSPLKGRKLSEEHKRKQREGRQLNPYPTKDSKIELLVQVLLREKGITFEKQKPIVGQPDIFIEPNICVFADGDYWHGWLYLNGKRYDNAKKLNNEFFEKRIQRDKRNTQLLKHQGYEVLRFWGHEIRENPEKCIQKILKAIK